MRLRETQEEVADGVVAGESLHSQHGMKRVISPQPLRVGKATRPRHHRRNESRERMRQRNGVVGGESRERQGRLQLLDIADLPQERNETGQTAERRDGLGGFVQNELGSAKERTKMGRGGLVRIGSRIYSHKPLLP